MSGGKVIPEPGSTSQGVEFRVGSDHYALPLEVATKVIPLSGESVEDGRVAYDGHDLSILTAADALGIKAGGVPAHTRGLLLSMDSQRFVLAVEEVLGVRSYEPGALRQAPSYFSDRTAALVDGLIVEADKLIVLLSPDRLLKSASLPSASDR